MNEECRMKDAQFEFGAGGGVGRVGGRKFQVGGVLDGQNVFVSVGGVGVRGCAGESPVDGKRIPPLVARLPRTHLELSHTPRGKFFIDRFLAATFI
jgi:hypothetical protein